MPQQPSSDANLVPLYQHRTSPDWGLGMLAWERGVHRGYQFEDGKLRVFRDGYFDMLDEVDTPADQARAVIDKLSLHVRAEAAVRPAAPPAAAAVTLDQQIQIFAQQHPDGFAGTAWQNHRRGEGPSRRVRRHRTPALADAATRLGAAALGAQLASGDAGAVIGSAIEVLAATDVVTASQLAPLRAISPARQADVGHAIHDLLWGAAGFDAGFDGAVTTLAKASRLVPSWPLVTALPALVHPTAHVHISPVVLRRQARFMAPRFDLGAAPNRHAYLRMVDMVKRIALALTAAGLPPADLWDVHDFMADTLAPKAIDLLDEA
ncbi:MAG: hypothetical protein R3B06_29115 [Kofleriaceae bacterium]